MTQHEIYRYFPISFYVLTHSKRCKRKIGESKVITSRDKNSTDPATNIWN